MPLNTLPVEILASVCEELDEDGHLALRLVSKELNEKIEDLHLHALYRSRNVFSSAAGFENLTKIATHPSNVNQLVKRLVFYVGRPFPSKRNKNTRERKSKMEADVRAQFEEREKMLTDGTHIAILSNAFKHLPKLDSIELAVGTIRSRSDFNMIFPSFRIKPGQILSESELRDIADNWVWRKDDYGDEMQESADSLWEILTRAAPSESIKHIDMNLPRGRGIQASNLTLESQALYNNLESFCLKFAPPKSGSRYSRNPDNPARITQRLQLLNWLHGIGQNLQTLSISFGDWSGFESWGPHDKTLVVLPEFPKLDKLRSLTLRSVDVEFDSFKAALGTYKNLEELRLYRVAMFPEAKYRLKNDPLDPVPRYWFEVLKYLRAEFRNLRVFHLAPHSGSDLSSFSDLREGTVPTVSIVGKWDSPQTDCVTIITRCPMQLEGIRRVTRRNLKEAFENHTDQFNFWEWVTGGKWKEETAREEAWTGCFGSNEYLMENLLYDCKDNDEVRIARGTPDYTRYEKFIADLDITRMGSGMWNRNYGYEDEYWAKFRTIKSDLIRDD
ncbi:hypothetical protein TWF694_003250 [Orbilia ellipsospora]|uniref:F-box domain-containing protein n=1 Tax=Orbilia ellipsospora TaxID=2528407 RepID=A0AAV9X723_9PEZI